MNQRPEKNSRTRYRKIVKLENRLPNHVLPCTAVCFWSGLWRRVGRETLDTSSQYILVFHLGSDSEVASPHLIFRVAGKCLHLWLGPAVPLSQTSGMCSRKWRDVAWDIAGCDRQLREQLTEVRDNTVRGGCISRVAQWKLCEKWPGFTDNWAGECWGPSCLSSCKATST